MVTTARQDGISSPLWEGAGARARSEVDRWTAVDKVIEAMHERIDRPFPLDDMASIAYLSRFYFNRVFREITGLPPVRFHTALRIAEAKRLLLTTELSVTDVCFELGYQSLGTFTSHFHELVGVSPRALRRAATAAGAVPAELAAAMARGQDSGAPAVEGEILGGVEGRSVFVGLFRQPCPQGLPFACAVLDGPGRYALRTDARGSFYVAAAAAADGDRPALVAVTRRPVRVAPGCRTRRDLRLRPLRRTDPPILLALPVASVAQDQGIDGHQPMPKAAGTLITQ